MSNIKSRTGRRRTAVPADRHKRAVAYRHRSAVVKKITPAAAEAEEIVIAAVEETAEEPAVPVAEAVTAEPAAPAEAVKAAAAVSILDKIKGFFGKLKKQPAEAESTVQETAEPEEVQETPAVQEVQTEAAEVQEAEEPAVTEVTEEAPAEETAAEQETEVQDAEPENTEAAEEEAEAELLEAVEEELTFETEEQENELAEEAAEVLAKKAEPAEEVPAEPETAEETPAEPVKEEIPAEAEEVEEPEPKKSLFGSYKARRAARRNEKRAQLDWEADLPKNGLLTMLLMPGTSIDKEDLVDGPVMGSFGALCANLIKWPVIASALVYPLYTYIQEKAFSVVSMNFTSAAMLVLKLAAFGFICEYVLLWTLDILGNLTRRAIEKRKLVSSVGRGSLGIALAFGISIAVMYFKGYAYGFAALTAAVVYSISLFAYGIDNCMRLNKTVQMIVILLLTFAFALAGYKYIAYVCDDVLKVLHYIANL